MRNKRNRKERRIERGLMEKRINMILLSTLLVILTLFSSLTTAQPELPRYEQFYGSVKDSNENFVGGTIKAYINETLKAIVTIQNGLYGYNELVFVEGIDGDEIKFYVDDEYVVNYSFQGEETIELNLTYNPPVAPPGSGGGGGGGGSRGGGGIIPKQNITNATKPPIITPNKTIPPKEGEDNATKEQEERKPEKPAGQEKSESKFNVVVVVIVLGILFIIIIVWIVGREKKFTRKNKK